MNLIKNWGSFYFVWEIERRTFMKNEIFYLSYFYQRDAPSVTWATMVVALLPYPSLLLRCLSNLSSHFSALFSVIQFVWEICSKMIFFHILSTRFLNKPQIISIFLEMRFFPWWIKNFTFWPHTISAFSGQI